MMEENNMSQLEKQKKVILSIIAGNLDSCEPSIREDSSRYAVDTEDGIQLFESFSDQELLELLRKNAQQLGHSPSQSEVHCLLRMYLKSRFKNWPNALRAAGLSRSAGKGGISAEQMRQKNDENQQMLDQVRKMAEQLGRIPHPSELPDLCQDLKKCYRTWGEVLTAAGVEEALTLHLHKVENLEANELLMLRELQAVAEGLNRAPLRSEVQPRLREPLLQRFKSWRNVLYQINLEPIRRISPFVNAPLQRKKEKKRATHRQELYDCHYRLLKLDPQTEADLALVQKLVQQLGHPPDRREVPAEVRIRLQRTCGSWSNALFQLGLQGKQEGC